MPGGVQHTANVQANHEDLASQGLLGSGTSASASSSTLTSVTSICRLNFGSFRVFALQLLMRVAPSTE